MQRPLHLMTHAPMHAQVTGLIKEEEYVEASVEE